MADVTSKISEEVVASPTGQMPDAWADFRNVELLGLEWTQSYRHSLGKVSRFFLELEQRRFLATRCPACHKVWAPPRPVCPEDLTITQWHVLGGSGKLVSWSVLHFAPKMLDWLQTPYVLAYVRLDGAHTLFAHLLQNYGAQASLYAGMPVRIVYNDGPVAHPLLLMAFEPADPEAP